jgi:hypothetical protein
VVVVVEMDHMVDPQILVDLVVLLVGVVEQLLEDLEQQHNHHNHKVFHRPVICNMETQVEILIVVNHILEQVEVVLVVQELLLRELQTVDQVELEDSTHNLMHP